ncbi:MAG: cytochrome P450 [Acidimicrobiia bacterium]
MTVSTSSDILYDPNDPVTFADPYPMFRRLREEAPLYHNEELGFFALSRFDDVERALVDTTTFSSRYSPIFESIRARVDLPQGVFIAEDPPMHTAHRGVLSRVFTPKKMSALEPQVRAYCAEALDPLVGGDRIDFVADLGAKMPMRVIGMMLGIPEEDQQEIRVRADRRMRRDSEPTDGYSSPAADPTYVADYIRWRATHPSDDLMTELLEVEFEDPTGEVRRLNEQEIITFVNVLTVAGNETTNRLIGWTGKVLGDHPDQRRQLVEDRGLIPNAIEEILRFEPPGSHIGRYVARNVELHGTMVPEGSAILLIHGAANRDHRAFPPDGDVFDITRTIGHHMTFGYGIHFCLGAALARLEGRIALDEVLDRFPEWTVDLEQAELAPSVVRGWDTLPAYVGTKI